MKEFAQLFDQLDMTSSTKAKVAAMANYFRNAEHGNAAWAIFFLMGRRLRRPVKTSQLRQWASELTGHPLWLIEESYDVVGDLAETLSLLVDHIHLDAPDLPLKDWVELRLQALTGKPTDQVRQSILQWWQELSGVELFVLNKLLSGQFRVGVSTKLLTRAIAEVAEQEPAVIAHRLMGDWPTTAEFVSDLFSNSGYDSSPAQPYPFFLASPLEKPVEELGPIDDWHAEWKWDGIRCQVIHREQQVFIWSRGEELFTQRFPELESVAHKLKEGVCLDGEILAWDFERNKPANFSELQKRISRKNVTPAIIRKIPVVLMAYDLMEFEYTDIRELTLSERRSKLAEIVSRTNSPKLRLSESVSASTWEDLKTLRLESRSRQVEGLMLKRSNSKYQVGRKRGDWFKWKVDPLTIDAVLIYAQKGHGRRANLFTDYTFAVWKHPAPPKERRPEPGMLFDLSDPEPEVAEPTLVTVAKAYSGLTDSEIRELDRWIKQNTREKWGPVRSVAPIHVFELAFEGISASKRHKAGVALRFPRMLRWRRDKPAEEANSVADLERLIRTLGQE